jgi:uncharacterized membrane protein
VAWKAVEGRENAGVVTFHELDEGSTRVVMQMGWEPDGIVKTAGAVIGSDSRRVRGDLERFKELIEGRRTESGAWPGDVENSADRDS